MPLQVGIVGRPGSGKTTLFNVLTRAGVDIHARKEHVGMAPIPDERLEKVWKVEGSAKMTRAALRVVDVPGIGPAQLGVLRQADALLAVLDGFSPGTNPASELEALKLELLVADRDHVERRLERVRSQAKSGDSALKRQVAELEALLAHVEQGGAIADYPGAVPVELEPLTTKPLVVVENGPGGIDLQLEAELAELSEEEAAELREGPAPIQEVVRRLEDALGLIAFFTGGPNETRAWTLRRGATALDAAGEIHSDMARGFIRCEVISWADLVECGSYAEASRRGLLRLEGKSYVVQDGDVLRIRFNV